jgi:outer membrane lipopolysaccharide assembly protein LptE/RlpB
VKNIKALFAIRYSLFILATMLLTACGYKPVSHSTKQTITAPLYLKVKLSNKEPDSGISLRDTLYQAIIYRLGVSTTTNSSASSRLIVSYNHISYTALGYDSNGYVERYRVNVSTRFDLTTQGRHISRVIKTTQEADVTPSALESSRAKREAIKACTEKAVDQFVAFIAAESVK